MRARCDHTGTILTGGQNFSMEDTNRADQPATTQVGLEATKQASLVKKHIRGKRGNAVNRERQKRELSAIKKFKMRGFVSRHKESDEEALRLARKQRRKYGMEVSKKFRYAFSDIPRAGKDEDKGHMMVLHKPKIMPWHKKRRTSAYAFVSNSVAAYKLRQILPKCRAETWEKLCIKLGHSINTQKPLIGKAAHAEAVSKLEDDMNMTVEQAKSIIKDKTKAKKNENKKELKDKAKQFLDRLNKIYNSKVENTRNIYSVIYTKLQSADETEARLHNRKQHTGNGNIFPQDLNFCTLIGANLSSADGQLIYDEDSERWVCWQCGSDNLKGFKKNANKASGYHLPPPPDGYDLDGEPFIINKTQREKYYKDLCDELEERKGIIAEHDPPTDSIERETYYKELCIKYLGDSMDDDVICEVNGDIGNETVGLKKRGTNSRVDDIKLDDPVEIDDDGKEIQMDSSPIPGATLDANLCLDRKLELEDTDSDIESDDSIAPEIIVEKNNENDVEVVVESAPPLVKEDDIKTRPVPPLDGTRLNEESLRRAFELMVLNTKFSPSKIERLLNWIVPYNPTRHVFVRTESFIDKEHTIPMRSYDDRLITERNVDYYNQPVVVVDTSAKMWYLEFNLKVMIVLICISLLFLGSYITNQLISPKISNVTGTWVKTAISYTTLFLSGNTAFGLFVMFAKSIILAIVHSRKYYLSYVPHAVSAGVLEFNHGTDPETAKTSVMQIIRRMAALPLPDRFALPLKLGSSYAILSELEHQSFFMERPLQWEQLDGMIPTPHLAGFMLKVRV